MTGLLILAVITIIVATVAKRMASTMVTIPMVFIGLGVVLSYSGLLPKEGAQEGLHFIAEIALVILLFLDAAKVNLGELIRERNIPLRMLLIGLPLSVLLGTLAAGALLPDWPIFTLALVAA
uniref:cation:proton antiporter domain-containing protein n=1 Tax=Kordiimonas sp. TaxID=1970157 RepID=UPI003A901A8A